MFHHFSLKLSIFDLIFTYFLKKSRNGPKMVACLLTSSDR